MTNDIGAIGTAAKTSKFDASLQLGLLGRVKDIDKGHVVFSPVVGALDEMAPAFNEGHVAAEFGRTAVTVGVKADFFAGPRKGGKIEIRTLIAAVGDAVCEERMVISIDEPVATVDFADSDRLSSGSACREGGSGT